MTNLVSKISVAKCHGKINRDDLPKGPILRVLGIARDTKQGPDKNKPGEFWTALVGDFVAIDAITGEEFRSGVCFLPTTAQNLVLGALGGDPNGVEFAIDIAVKKAENIVGYEYTVSPAVKPKESDAMLALMAKANEAKPLAIGNETGADKKAKK